MNTDIEHSGDGRGTASTRQVELHLSDGAEETGGTESKSFCERGRSHSKGRMSTAEGLPSVEQAEADEAEKRSGELLPSFKSDAEVDGAEKKAVVLEETAIERKLRDLKLSLQFFQKENRKWISACHEAAEEREKRDTWMEKLSMKLSGARWLNPQRSRSEDGDAEQDLQHPVVGNGPIDKLCTLEGEVDWTIEDLKLLHETNAILQDKLKLSASAERGFVLRESALANEILQLKSTVKLLDNEKESLRRASAERDNELEKCKEDIEGIYRTIKSVDHTQNGTEGGESLSNLVLEVETLIQEKKSLKEIVDGLHVDVLTVRKEMDKMVCREASLDKENGSLKFSLQEVTNDQKSWITASEMRLAELERQKVELDNSLTTWQLTSEENGIVRKQNMELTFLLSQKLKELETMKKRLKDFEEEKGGQHHTQTESAHYRSTIISLRKELSSAKVVPVSLMKERDSLQRELDKLKSKLKDVEAKLKTTLQEKFKLESEKLNVERELKQLRQSESLRREVIHRRDSTVDQRRRSLSSTGSASISSVGSVSKDQLSSEIDHAMQMKSDEVGKLRYDLCQSREAYASLEFVMAEAESVFNERLTELKREKEALQRELTLAKEHSSTTEDELKTVKYELEGLLVKLHERGEMDTAGQESAKERDHVVEELRANFEKQKSDLIAQVQGNRIKCDALNQGISLLTDELQNFKTLQEECSDVNRMLHDRLQQALEAASENSLKHQKLVNHLEADLESCKERCRELDLKAADAPGNPDSVQLDKVKGDLETYKMKVSHAHEAERVLLLENRELLIANTKLQVTLDACRGRVEVFEGRLDVSQRELSEYKIMSQKAESV